MYNSVHRRKAKNQGRRRGGECRVWSLGGYSSEVKSKELPKECAFGALVDPFCAFFLLYIKCYTFGLTPLKVLDSPFPQLAIQ